MEAFPNWRRTRRELGGSASFLLGGAHGAYKRGEIRMTTTKASTQG
jgi:hypothetical protein